MLGVYACRNTHEKMILTAKIEDNGAYIALSQISFGSDGKGQSTQAEGLPASPNFYRNDSFSKEDPKVSISTL